MISELCILICGLYIGKHYPQYVPIPRISKDVSDRILKYLENMQKTQTPESSGNDDRLN